VPVTGDWNVEARCIGESFKAGDSSTHGNHVFRYSGLGGVVYDLGSMTFACGGGIHYFDENYEARSYAALGFELNEIQRIETIFTFDLEGEVQPMGAGVVFSVGI
jgi:hypothetical protein